MISYFNSRKWLALLIILLVALNVATITAFWLLRERRPGPPPSQNNVAAFLVKELGFDSAQKQQLEQLVEQHRRQVMDIRRNNRAAKDSFFALLNEPTVGDSVLAAAATRATAPDRQMDMYTFRHFQQVRALCTPAQKIKFDAVIKEVLRMTAPPQDQHGPPPGGRGERPGPGGPPPDGGQGPPPGDEHRPPPPQ